ncbi:MAG: DUF5522 domain-containing protein [Acidobacteria bacterium]|nr:DUF5522 domain-containing protein [Acidobacteriota bacterium]
MESELVEGEDFYREGPYVVFTEGFLRRRGWCCESGCRHCPWGYRRDQRGDAPVPPSGEDGTGEG